MNIVKENLHSFSNFLKNVINDLYKLSFQNYCAKEQLKLHRSLLGVKRGAKISPLNISYYSKIQYF